MKSQGDEPRFRIDRFCNASLAGFFFLLSRFWLFATEPTACIARHKNDDYRHDSVQNSFVLRHLALPFFVLTDNSLVPALNDKFEH